MEISTVGERLLNEFLGSDEPLSPETKTMLDTYLAQMTNYVSSLQYNTLMSPTENEHQGNATSFLKPRCPRFTNISLQITFS
jgi:hypothetical protein